MGPEICCEVCGNAHGIDHAVCPFCGSGRGQGAGGVHPPEALHRTVNLERNLPTTAQALERLRTEIASGTGQGFRVLTFIHGYGSSGSGGLIRREVRRQLELCKARGTINDFIPGEEFFRRHGSGKQLLRQFPALAGHRDLNRANPGITLVILPASKRR